MSATSYPEIVDVVDVLVRLWRDYQIKKNRYERRRGKHSQQFNRLDRQLGRLNRLDAARSDKGKSLKKRLAVRIEAADAEADREETDYSHHPYRDVVKRIARWTGLNSADIFAAVSAEFSGHEKVVDKLHKLEERGKVRELYQLLIAQHPVLAAKIGLGREGESAGESVAGHTVKAKRSTEQGEARTKIISALNRHHQYDNGSCGKLEPIRVNDLARKRVASKAGASKFFKGEFGSHAKYRAECTNAGRLAFALKQLNGENTPGSLFKQLGEFAEAIKHGNSGAGADE